MIRGEVTRKKLDRHRTVQPRVAGLIHLTHAAGPQELYDRIRSDLSAQREPLVRTSSRGFEALQKLAGLLLVRKQRLHLAPKRFIISGALQISVALFWGPLAGAMVQPFNCLPSFRQHPRPLPALDWKSIF